MRKTAGLLLAGGLSTRMMQDKAEMIWNGESLLCRQTRILSELLGPGSVGVSGGRRKNGIPDEEQGLGPLEGVRSSLGPLMKRGFDSVLVIPVDMPFLDSELLTGLLNSSANGDASCFENHMMPVLFLDLPRVLSVIDVLKSNRDRKYSFRELYKDLRMEHLPIQNKNKFVNINTLEEWRAAVSASNSIASNW